ncbi:MAG TPA: NADH-quinone oxidoreductase subunit N [Chryseosolibacter sp.]
MQDQVNTILQSFGWVIPEIILCSAFLIILVAGLFRLQRVVLLTLALITFASVGAAIVTDLYTTSPTLFGMMHTDGVSSFVKMLINISALLTCVLSIRNKGVHRSEYFAFLVAIVFGAHLLVMTTNFLLIFISIEIISISSYVLAGYFFDKKSAEGSLKYFLFGSVSAAVMLYGFSFLYGFTGSIDFATNEFVSSLASSENSLTYLALFFVLAGFLFKISSAPMHFWAPDVYESAPAPVVAFLSTVPKLAGLTVLLKFLFTINLGGQSPLDWQFYITCVAILTITVGNFAALKQTNVKRMMAYSSIAQSGFLMIGLIVFLPQGVEFFLFYASVYVVSNFLVFALINSFEISGTTTIAEYSGTGKIFVLTNVLLLVGLISLTGLPPTAGFTAKLFVFSALWAGFQQSGNTILITLLVVGLLNTVVSLFYYLRIPYYAFLKNGKPAISHNILSFENLLGAILVLVLLILFFQPGLLMSWINKINFVL